MKNKKFRTISFIYLLMMVLFVGVLIMSSLRVQLPNNGYEYIIQILIMLTIPLLMYSLFVTKSAKKTISDFGIKKVSFKVIIISIILGGMLFLLNCVVSSTFNTLIYYLGYQPLSLMAIDTGALFTDILLVAILPGICEEITHRGMMLHATKSSIGTKKALIISSLLFGLMHLNIQQFFYASILGFFIGLAALLSDSIFPAMIIHFMNNFLSIMMDYFGGSSLQSFVSKYLGVTSDIGFFLIMVVGFALLGGGIYYCYVLLKKYRDKKNITNLVSQLSSTDGVLDSAMLSEAMSSNETKFIIDDTNAYKAMPSRYKVGYRMTLILGFVITISTFVWNVI